MLWTVIGILVALWLAMQLLHLLGAVVHLLLIVAVVILVGKAIAGSTSRR